MSSADIKTYRMHERADHPDFDIRFQGTRAEISEPHRHGYFQIQAGLEGDCQQVIGGSIRPFGRGYLSFVLPHRIHIVHHPPESQHCVINFDRQFMWPDMEIDELDLDDLPPAKHPELAPFLFQEYVDFLFEDEDFTKIVGWLNDLHECNLTRGFGTSAFMRGILSQIVGLACMRHSVSLTDLFNRHAGKPSRHDALRRVMRYVRDHLTEEISLAQAAETAFLSPNYLANLIKRETGQTFTDLVTDKRIAKAKDLLASSTLLVREVAKRCGYVDEAYFNRRFQQRVGCTPRQFRMLQN